MLVCKASPCLSVLEPSSSLVFMKSVFTLTLLCISGSVLTFKNTPLKSPLLPNLRGSRRSEFPNHCATSGDSSGFIPPVRSWPLKDEGLQAALGPHPAELMELGREIRHLLLDLLMLSGLLFKLLFHFV